MADLASTTLAVSIRDAKAQQVALASSAAVTRGQVIWFDGEACQVTQVLSGGVVKVIRGWGGTSAKPHGSGCTVYIGDGAQFRSGPPSGTPEPFPPVNPWIDLRAGVAYLAQGDQVGGNVDGRWWQPITVTRGIGALGGRVSSVSPTSST